MFGFFNRSYTIGNYKYIPSVIGQGSFSIVYKGSDEKNNPVAIKKIISSISIDTIDEIKIMKKLNHKHIVKLIDVIKENNDVFLIMEFCECGTLADFLNKKPLKEKYSQSFIFQISLAIKYLFDNHIMHRDIKPQNILLSNKTFIKLADFGFAKIFNKDEEQLAQTICGSPLYMAPEIIKCNQYTIKADLWSIGVILYEMIVGKPPFKAKNHIELLNKIDNEPIYLPSCIHISQNCRDLIHQLLQKNPNTRISINDFCNHSWILNNDSDEESENKPNKINLGNLIIDDYIPKSKSIPISTKSNETTNSDMFVDSYVSPMFNTPVAFTPNEKTGFIIVDKSNNIISERNITDSLFNYMSNTLNYFKSYY